MQKKIFSLFTMVFLFSLFLVGCGDKARVTGIEITSLPTKLDYVEGETFDPTGLEVKKIMSDGTKNVITDYTLDKTVLTADDTVVNVIYRDFTSPINITVEPFVRKLVDVEFKVQEGLNYTRTMNLADYVQYREVYNDGTYEDWADVTPEDLVEYSIENGVLTVTASLIIKNKEWTKEFTVPVDDDYITVDELITKEVDETTYLVNGILVAITSTMNRVEYILWEKDTNTFLGVTGLNGGGVIYEYTLETNGFEVGDELRIPVKLVRANTQANYSDSDKLYAQFVGGDILSTAIVSRNNPYETEKENVVVISNQQELIDFLSPENRVNNFYQVVKLHGKMRYIYYSGSKHYRFFFDENIKTLEAQLIDNCSPCFANGIQYYTTGVTIGEMLWNDEEFAPTNWSSPATATKDIYALFIGGNTYYHEFAFLSTADVEEVTPILIETTFVSPSKVAYFVGDDLDLSGAKIVNYYDYGTPNEVAVTLDMLDASSLPNMDQAGEYTVKGSYNGFEFSFVVTVTDKTVISVELVNEPDKTKFHYRETIEDVKIELAKLSLRITYSDDSEETVAITENMISFDEEWTFGQHSAVIHYLSEQIEFAFVVENQGVSVTEIKTKPAGETVYDLHGIVLSSVFISGTAANPVNGEILIKDINTGEVIGLKGIYLSYTNKLGDLNIGDEILVKVKVIITTTTANVSENGKKAVEKYGDDEIIVLSQNNDTMLDLDTAVLVASQEQLVEFLKDAETRAQNAYRLIKLCAGAKIVNYALDTSSSYITFTGTNITTTQIDSICPFLHQMNETMTLNGDTYLNLLFGEGASPNTNFANGNVLNRDVYLMYVGGQGIYYHQLVLLDTEYVTDEASQNLKEIIFTKPSKVSYRLGEELDLTGGKIDYIYFYEPHNKTITLDESMITSDPIDMNVGGEYVIQFTYEGETFEYTILVSEGVLDYIEIASLPTKTVYSHREGIENLDLSGGKLRLVFTDGASTVVDLARSMLPETESEDWKIGVVEYTLTYEGKTTVLPVTYQNQAISVSEFLTKESGTYDVTGIILGPVSSFGAAELLLKDVNTMDIIGIYNTDIVGSFSNILLDTSVVNIGDKVIVTLSVGVVVADGGSKNKVFANAVSKQNFMDGLIIESSGNPLNLDLSQATVSEIATQEDLVNFLNNDNRYYSFVKLVRPKAVSYNNNYRIFFGDEVTNLNTQKVNGYSPYIAKTNSDFYLEGGMAQYFNNPTSTSYSNPVTTDYEIYALFVGGNVYYHVFAILDASWFVQGE
jgi:hypothetical protein